MKRFRVEVENQPVRHFETPDEALSFGIGNVYLGPDGRERALDQLMRGERVDWTYGFGSVTIVPNYPPCAHHWTVTSECPSCLRRELDEAYAELRRLWYGYHVLFDRTVYDRAQDRAD